MVITLPSDTLLTIQQAQPSKNSSRGYFGIFFWAKFFCMTRNQSLNLVEVLLNNFRSLGDLCRLHRTHFLIRGAHGDRHNDNIIPYNCPAQRTKEGRSWNCPPIRPLPILRSPIVGRQSSDVGGGHGEDLTVMADLLTRPNTAGDPYGLAGLKIGCDVEKCHWSGVRLL